MRSPFLPVVTAWLTAAALIACSPSMPAPTRDHPASSGSATRTPRSDASDCNRHSAIGDIDRSALDLRFTTGRILIALTPTTDPGSAHGGPGGGGPADGDSASQVSCYAFAKSGNPSPEVPPDSLLFTFAGAGTDGAQIEFLAGDLTGGARPPLSGHHRPVEPLTTPITAQIGVSVSRIYHFAATCRLRLTALRTTLGAGEFDCPTATESAENPFAPDERAHDPASSATPTPTRTYRLTGWFELTP